MSVPGRLVVVSGPSGAGKTTICKKLLNLGGFERVVTCTTRPPRGTEQNGVDYHFLHREDFERDRDKGRFLEDAEVHGNYYGTPREQVEDGIQKGTTLLLNIDVQGAQQLREAQISHLTSVFIEPPSLGTLEERLAARNTDSPDEIERRLEQAREELKERIHYDHIVVNADLKDAVSEVLQALNQPPKSS